MRKYPYRFNKTEKEKYNKLVKELSNEGYFLKDARAKARSITSGVILSSELELSR